MGYSLHVDSDINLSNVTVIFYMYKYTPAKLIDTADRWYFTSHIHLPALA